MQMEIDRVLLTRHQIASRVRDMGTRIAHDLSALLAPDDQHLTIIPIMTGSMVFVADLIREIPLKLRIEVLGVSSYPGKSIESKGASMRGDLPKDLAGRHVLLVDDILDSGQTLDLVTRLLQERQPASLRTCVFLRKPGKARPDLVADYVGFEIPDEFVVGYGLDFDGFYRNLPDIAILKRSDA